MRILESSFFSAPAAIFCATWAEAHHRFSGSHSVAAAVAAIVASYLFHASVATWVVTDAQQRGYPLCFQDREFSLFLLVVVISWVEIPATIFGKPFFEHGPGRLISDILRAVFLHGSS